MPAVRNDGRQFRRPRFAYIRWTILGLFGLAMVLSYLSRSVLGVAAPMGLSEQSISSEQYWWITSAFQLGVMFQPLVGFSSMASGCGSGSPSAPSCGP